MSLLMTAAAVAAGLVAAGVMSGVRRSQASTAAMAQARERLRDALAPLGAALSEDDTVTVPWAGRAAVFRMDAGVKARLVDRDAPVPPRGAMMSVVLPLSSVTRLAHQLLREWEPLGPGSWPGGAYPEPELCVALREQRALHEAVRHLLERWPMLGFTLDNDGTWEVFVDAAVRDAPDDLRAFWTDLVRAADAWEAAGPILVEVATTVRGAPGAVALPPRPALGEGAARVEGAPIAVPLGMRDRD